MKTICDMEIQTPLKKICSMPFLWLRQILSQNFQRDFLPTLPREELIFPEDRNSVFLLPEP